MFKSFEKLLESEPVTLTADRVGCMGGKFYTGFSSMNERIPTFVSCKEKYKKTPDLFLEFVKQADVKTALMTYLNISPVDKIESFDGVIGIFFLGTPDIISGLTSWAFFDRNSDDTVTSKFGSGCSAIFSEVVNMKDGKRTFLGLFDPSVRYYVGENILSFSIPMSRFKEMYYTMRDTCLFGTHGWEKVKNRICCREKRKRS